MNQEERSDLVSRLFALITSKLDEGAGEAADGQGKGKDDAEQIARAERIEIATRDVGLLAEAAAAILRGACSTLDR